MSEIEKNYFLNARPNIYENKNLREAQIYAHARVFEHFVQKGKTTHAIVVLPTGVGKTGLMGLLPYGIAEGRVLIITPQLTIKDTVLDSLDPENPESFWMQRRIFKNISELPVLVEYDKKFKTRKKEILDPANIIVLNSQKLQSRLKTSPLNFLPEDYFDMIIIDEAHHSVAKTWVEAIKHFNKAKVVKLTGTPIRSDNEPMVGDLVYKYKLSQAMAKGYVKSLKNFEYIPDRLYFTIDNDLSKEYTKEELLKLNLRDEDWIKRSVAYSKDCSMQVVRKSIELLEEKKRGSNVPHKIIAVACSIKHAEDIRKLYIHEKYRATVIHSDKSSSEIESIFSDIENNRLDVIINVAMLGEGYDHPYLSVAAIFRPFKNELPYEQFIGRVLRSIPEDEISAPKENIADVVAHKELGLHDLWIKYKKEVQESEIIKNLTNDEINDFDDSDKSTSSNTREEEKLGIVVDNGIGTLQEDAYMNTELIKQAREDQRKQEEKVNELIKVLNINRAQAIDIINQTQANDNMMKRPDLFFRNKTKDLDNEIREVLVPEFIMKYQINQHDKSLEECQLFTGKYKWIVRNSKDNGAMLAMYVNDYLRKEIGKKRAEWDMNDYDKAFEKLSVAKEYIDEILSEYVHHSLSSV